MTRAASTAPRPPGVGAAEPRAAATRYAAPISGKLTPPPKAATAAASVRMNEPVTPVEPPISPMTRTGSVSTSASDDAALRACATSGGSTRRRTAGTRPMASPLADSTTVMTMKITSACGS